MGGGDVYIPTPRRGDIIFHRRWRATTAATRTRVPTVVRACVRSARSEVGGGCHHRRRTPRDNIYAPRFVIEVIYVYYLRFGGIGGGGGRRRRRRGDRRPDAACGGGGSDGRDDERRGRGGWWTKEGTTANTTRAEGGMQGEIERGLRGRLSRRHGDPRRFSTSTTTTTARRRRRRRRLRRW